MTTTDFEVAPLDSYAERITMGIALLGGVLMLPALFWFLSQIHFAGVVIPVAIAVALAVWLLLNYAVQPTSYMIAADQLVIRRRLARRMRIPLKEIVGVSVAAALADVPRFGLRRSFNAGVFGYQGPFRLDPYGAVFFVATNRARLVAVARLARPPLILSPARSREFVEALRERLMTIPQ
jgi:PH (Pleckstrin Homology) domain-containing protein